MDSSQLSRLPPEIRDQIYTTVFSFKYAVTLQSGLVQHSLTKTCRQIRQETLAMFYALTRFNAHLDDGPATPLAKWFTTLGPDLTLLLNEINIWDIRMLNGTLHGSESTKLLLNSPLEDSSSYILQPLGSWIFNRGWYLKDIILALHSIGLGLSRFCIKSSSCPTVKLTSDFAIVRLFKHDEYNEVNALAQKFGLSEKARENLILRLAAGERRVMLQERHRKLLLDFDGTRGTNMRQVLMSEVAEQDVDSTALGGEMEDSND